MPILRDDQLDLISQGSEQTRRLGIRLGSLLRAGDIVCLSGDLGAGKTLFACGIGIGWGAREAVTSPTYNLVHQHSRAADSTRFYHLDCYRLSGAGDAASIDADDIFAGDSIAVVEWWQHIAEVIPDDRLVVALKELDDMRRNLIFTPQGERARALLAAFRGG